jgi:hypothetical protein
MLGYKGWRAALLKSCSAAPEDVHWIRSPQLFENLAFKSSAHLRLLLALRPSLLDKLALSCDSLLD